MANKSHLIHLKGVDIAYTWDISLSMADKKWWMTTMGGQSKNTDIFHQGYNGIMMIIKNMRFGIFGIFPMTDPWCWYINANIKGVY